MTQSCKTCRYLEVPVDADGVRIVWTGRAYSCAAPVLDLVSQFPACFAIALDRRKMFAWDGTDCPTWQKREG